MITEYNHDWLSDLIWYWMTVFNCGSRWLFVVIQHRKSEFNWNRTQLDFDFSALSSGIWALSSKPARQGVETLRYMYEHVQRCTVMYGHVRSCTSMYSHVPWCTSMYSLVHGCTWWYMTVHAGTCWYINVQMYTVNILEYCNYSLF